MIMGRHVVPVHKIHRWVLLKPRQVGRGFYGPQLVPTHVRHLEAVCGVEWNDFALEEVKPGMDSVLVTGREQELQPQANAEKRLTGANMSGKRRHQSGLMQSGDGVSKGADPGKNHLVRFAEPIRIA